MNNKTDKNIDLLVLYQNYVRRTRRKAIDKEEEYETRTKNDYKSHLKRFPFDTIANVLSVNTDQDNNNTGWKIETDKTVESLVVYKEYYNGTSLGSTDESTWKLYNFYKDNEGGIFDVQDTGQPKYLTLIIDFYKKGDLLYARTVANFVLRIAEKANSFIGKYEEMNKRKRLKNGKKTSWGKEVVRFGKKLSALKKFCDFLNYDDNLAQNVTEPYRNSDEIIKEIIDYISKPMIDKIDGAKELAKVLGGEMEFIKQAIEQSYFFDPIIVYDRMIKLAYDLADKKTEVPARKTTKEDKSQSYKQIEDPKDSNIFYYHETIGQNTYSQLIERDKDGNQAVRDLIKKYTGYTIGEGQGSIFKNYVISHVWGKAYDPRYFTNFANIVLVPAWANGLMDKVANKEGSLESILQSTLMAICHNLYCEKWEQTPDDKVKGNIVKMKSDVENKIKQKVGDIKNKKKLIQKKMDKNEEKTIIDKKEKELQNLEKSLAKYNQTLAKLDYCLNNWNNIWDIICNNIPIKNLTILHDKDVKRQITKEDNDGKKQKVPYKYNINLICNHGWDKLEIPDPYHESKVGYITKMEITL